MIFKNCLSNCINKTTLKQTPSINKKPLKVTIQYFHSVQVSQKKLPNIFFSVQKKLRQELYYWKQFIQKIDL